jgi:hypothetical protein
LAGFVAKVREVFAEATFTAGALVDWDNCLAVSVGAGNSGLVLSADGPLGGGADAGATGLGMSASAGDSTFGSGFA